MPNKDSKNMNSLYLDYFDEYVAKGLMPIAIISGTKQPVEPKWNINWSVRRWRGYFSQEEKEYEIGILWNKKYVDVETDNEKSNIFLNKLIGNLERPVFKSKRSYHNIFLNPNPSLTKVNLFGRNGEKIEIFGSKTYTLAPPSNHIEGIKYSFVNNFWPPPVFPNALKAFYFQQKKIVIENKQKTLTICKSCGKKQLIHKKRLALEVNVFLKNNLDWKCRDCRKNFHINLKEECRLFKKSAS
jgi:hypothetical protein